MLNDNSARRVQDLLETTNRYLDRARSAEARATYYKDRMRQWKAAFGRTLKMASEATLELSIVKRDFERCAAKWKADTLKIADERDEARRKIVELEDQVNELQIVDGRLRERIRYLTERETELVEKLNGLRRVKHRKRGSFYSVLGDLSFQLAAPAHDVFSQFPFSKIFEGDTIRVYRSEFDGKLYGRFPDEFEDGRFEDVREPIDG